MVIGSTLLFLIYLIGMIQNPRILRIYELANPKESEGFNQVGGSPFDIAYMGFVGDRAILTENESDLFLLSSGGVSVLQLPNM